MPSSSYRPRRTTTWAAEQNPRPLPRIVRLGRPANDNFRHVGVATKAMIAVGAAAVAALAAINWLM